MLWQIMLWQTCLLRETSILRRTDFISSLLGGEGGFQHFLWETGLSESRQVLFRSMATSNLQFAYEHLHTCMTLLQVDAGE